MSEQRKTERADPTKPFTVRKRLGKPPTLPGMTQAAADPIFFDAPISVRSAIADAKLYQLKRETAINLLVGHIRLIAQVLALPEGCLGDVIADVGVIFDREESPHPTSLTSEPPVG